MITIWVCLKNTWAPKEKQYFKVLNFSLIGKYLRFTTEENIEYDFFLENYDWGIE